MKGFLVSGLLIAAGVLLLLPRLHFEVLVKGSKIGEVNALKSLQEATKPPDPGAPASPISIKPVLHAPSPSAVSVDWSSIKELII